MIEEDEEVARRLHERGRHIVHARLSDQEVDLAPLAGARALVLNGNDDDNVLVTLGAREAGFEGPIVAMITEPRLRSPLLSAGVNVTFAPYHVLAAVLSSRASAKISPRVTGFKPLSRLLDVAELRVHDGSPLAGRSLAEVQLRTQTGAHVVAQWEDGRLNLPPAPNERIPAGTMLVAAGTPESMVRLSEIARPITDEGVIIVIGMAEVGQKLVEILSSVDEQTCVLDAVEGPGVDIVGEVSDPNVLAQLPLSEARVAILSLETDSATVLAATLLRQYAPDLPIIASTELSNNVASIQHAGADFAMSLSQVAGQLLVHHVLGETVSIQPRIKLARVEAGRLEGKNPLSERIRERTGCTVVAVEREGELIMTLPPSFRLASADSLYICGTADAIQSYQQKFPASWL